MASIARGTKAAGGTSFTSGTILASEVNTDFDNIYNDHNGNIDNANIAAAAAIAATKIDDISSSDTNHAATTTPGDSSGHTNPTTLSGELQQVRHILEMHGLGIDAERVDGTGTVTAFWGDRPARMVNLIKNPNFGAGAPTGTTPPTGWTDLGVGTPTYSHVALAGANLTEGKGVALRIEAGSAAAEGCSQTLHLKASTRYLVVARAKGTSGTVHLKTTGADVASSYRDINDSSASASFVTLKGVIQTDATPTNIVVKLTVQGGAATDDVQFAFCGVYECSADLTQIGPTPWVVSTSTGPVAISNVVFTDLGVTATVYANDGQQIEVDAEIPMIRNAASGAVGVMLMENVAGGGAAEVAYTEVRLDTNGAQHVRLSFVRQEPTPGSSYVYTVTAKSQSLDSATIPGATDVAGAGTKRIELRARSVRVSQ